MTLLVSASPLWRALTFLRYVFFDSMPFINLTSLNGHSLFMNDVQRLKEMGIPVWGLRRPELFPHAALNSLTLPDTCKLLFVSDVTPNEHDAWLFGKILASMKLTPDQALRLPREALSNLKSHSLEWCWFAGVDAIAMADVKQLTSPSLSLLQDNPDAKKALWVQIRQYER